VKISGYNRHAVTPTKLKIAETVACHDGPQLFNSSLSLGLPNLICINDINSDSLTCGKLFGVLSHPIGFTRLFPPESQVANFIPQGKIPNELAELMSTGYQLDRFSPAQYLKKIRPEIQCRRSCY
jgi:hypothetical protein